MEPIEILIKKKLDAKVLKGLDDKTMYNVIFSSSGTYLLNKGAVKDFKDKITHIYLPITVTSEMVEKAAINNYPQGMTSLIGSRERSIHEHKKESFINGYNWLLSLTNKDREDVDKK